LFCPVGHKVTGIGFVVGGAIGVRVGSGSVKEETREFQNAIFPGSIFLLTEDVGPNEIKCLSLTVYAGHLLESSVGFLYQILRPVNTKIVKLYSVCIIDTEFLL